MRKNTWYFPSEELEAEIPYTNDKINNVVKLYNEIKRLFDRQTHKEVKL